MEDHKIIEAFNRICQRAALSNGSAQYHDENRADSMLVAEFITKNLKNPQVESKEKVNE